MSRLTKEEILQFPKTTYGRALGKTIASKCVNELLQYKDLEEQLGCPLEVIFKALGHWIYDEDGNAWYIEHYYQECNVYQLHSVRHHGRIADKKFNTKDYKKTWFLKKDKSE